jgi:hypothetical protein
LQIELKAAHPDLNIEIVGINKSTDAIGNPVITDERALPWLQDDANSAAWRSWKAEYRDVRILDAQNRLLATYNLSSHDLSIAANRAALKKLFLDAAKITDVDSDRLPDDWELRYFGSLDATAEADADGDGSTNFNEFAFGTDPKDATSKPALLPTLVKNSSESSLALKFFRRAGDFITYQIETSSTLDNWISASGQITPIRNLFDGTGSAEERCTVRMPAASIGFLRVRAVAK